MRKTALILFLMLAAVFTTHAQDKPLNTEEQIKAYLNQIQYWRYQYSPDDSGVNPNASPTDSLVAANKMLIGYLQNITAALRNNFKYGEDAGITIATSPDRRMRIFSWDTETGNGTHRYNAVALYETLTGVKSRVLNDASDAAGTDSASGRLYTSITVVGSTKKYYVALYTGIASEKYAFKGAQAFNIDNDQLTDASIFQTANSGSNIINYSYDYFANYDYKTMKERSILHIDKGRLMVPVVEMDKVTDKWDIYEFDGNKYNLKK